MSIKSELTLLDILNNSSLSDKEIIKALRILNKQNKSLNQKITSNNSGFELLKLQKEVYILRKEIHEVKTEFESFRTNFNNFIGFLCKIYLKEE